MESKQMTLRSQTVQCPHCGEYYSVTYKYCPFCDAGRKAEERKKAARKQRTASLFAGLLGGKEEDVPDAPIQEIPEASRRRRDPDGQDRPRKHRAPPAAPVDMPPRSEGFRRKKSSEMTPEERAAYRAEREARAAARKRARDAAARQSVLLETGELLETPVASGVSPVDVPIMEDVMIPEGVQPAEQAAGTPENEAESTAPAEIVPADLIASPVDDGPAPDPMDLPPVAPEAGNAASGQAPEDEWSFLKDLPVGEGDSETAAPEIPPLPEMETPADVQIEEILPEATAAAPSSSISTDSELDALLNEIRGILDGTASAAPAAEEPAPETAQDAPEKASPVPAEPAPAPQEEPDRTEVPAKEEEAAAESAPAESPTEPADGEPKAEPETEEAAKAPYESNADTDRDTPAEEADVPAEEASGGEPEEESEEAAEARAAAAQAKAFEEATLLWSSPEENGGASSPIPAPAVPGQTERRRSRSESRPQPRKRIPILPILAAIIVVAAVAVLVNKGIAPAIQSETTQADTAETLTLDRTVLTLTAEGATETLIPIFSPEGTTAQVKWTCSNWGAVFVHEGGILTAMAPGTATVVATMANGESAECVVTCQWDPNAPPAAPADGEAASSEPVKVGLNTTDLTLDSQGKTQQLVLEGTEGSVRWSSSKTSVASVSGDGTVTAVGKGAATVTAELDGQRYNCEVRCIW